MTNNERDIKKERPETSAAPKSTARRRRLLPVWGVELLRHIGKTWVSFLALAIIIGVSVAVLLGTGFSAMAMRQEASDFFDQYRLHDFEIVSALGLTPEDIEELRALDGVAAAEGCYSTTATARTDIGMLLLAVNSLTSDLDQSLAVQGTLPQAADEIAIEERMAVNTGLTVGDRLTLDGRDREGLSLLANEEYTISAVVRNPAYISNFTTDVRGVSGIGNGAPTYYVVVTEAAFDHEQLEGNYTRALVTASALEDLDVYSKAYGEARPGAEQELIQVGAARCGLRFEQIQAEARQELDQGWEELLDAEQELAEAEQELADTEQELAEAEQTLETSRQELEEAEAELVPVEQRLAASERELSAAEAQVAEGERQLAEVDRQIATGEFLTSGELVGNFNDLEAKRAEVAAARSQVNESRRQLNAAKSQAASARAQIEDGKIQLEEGLVQLEEGRIQFADGQAQYEEGRAEAAQARAELEDAEAQLEALGEEKWQILNLDSNAGYTGLETSSANVSNLRLSFALIFILVALMVCYTSIGRMVTEQRELIGAQKALGMTQGEIIRRFLVYTGLSAFLGALLGWAMCIFPVQQMALFGYSPLYVFEDYDFYFRWGPALLSLVGAMAATALITWAAVRQQVNEDATSLLRGARPPQRRTLSFEKGSGWKKLSFSTRLMIKNLVNDKRRVLMTIVGVAGCTALLVISLSMRMSVVGAVRIQYDEIYSYDMRLITDERPGDEATAAFAQRLDEEAGAEYIQVSDKLNFFRSPGGDWSVAHVICGDDLDGVERFFDLREEKSKRPLTVSDSGVLISSRAAEINGWQEGDQIELMDAVGNTCTATIAGVFENYAFHMMMMSGDYYRAITDREFTANTFYINTNGGDGEALRSDLAAMEAFMSCDNGSAERTMFDRLVTGVNMLILLLFILSAVMAAMVLLDLNFMFIKANTRQLAVMRVNGYSIASTKAYIYRDNIILTILGILVGVALGILLGRWIIMSIEEDFMRFIRTPMWNACLMSAAISAFFMLVVNLVTLRKVDKLDLHSVSAN